MGATSGVTGSSLPPGDDALIRRIQDLERVVRELGPGLMMPITAQFNTLTAQQATLTAAVENIAALVNNEVEFGASGTSATGFGLTSTPTNRAASTIGVPAGYSRAIVHVTVDATAVNTVLSGLLMLSANINGTSGGENSGAPGPNSYYANGGASAIRTLTGLSGGNITVAATVHCDAGTWPAMAWNIVNCNAIAVFLR